MGGDGAMLHLHSLTHENRIFYTDISDHLPIFLISKLNNDIKDDVTIETRIYND